MGHLQHLDVGRNYVGLSGVFDVTRQKDCWPGRIDQEDNRLVVGILVMPLRSQNIDPQVIERDARRDLGHRNGNALRFKLRFNAVPGGALVTVASIPKHADRHSSREPDEPGDVIIVRMRRDDQVKASDPMAPECPPELAWTGTAVDEDHPAFAGGDQHRVTLTDVEKDHSRTAQTRAAP